MATCASLYVMCQHRLLPCILTNALCYCIAYYLSTCIYLMNNSAGREQLLRRLLSKNTNTLTEAQIQEIVKRSAGTSCLLCSAYSKCPDTATTMKPVSIIKQTLMHLAYRRTLFQHCYQLQLNGVAFCC
jgi:hypothetical protein